MPLELKILVVCGTIIAWFILHVQLESESRTEKKRADVQDV
jgi:hypothetical protein